MLDIAHSICLIKLYQIRMRKNFDFLFLTTLKSLFKIRHLRLQLHGAIYRPDSFLFMPHYCANLKAIGYESTSLNRIVADKLHCVIVA